MEEILTSEKHQCMVLFFHDTSISIPKNELNTLCWAVPSQDFVGICAVPKPPVYFSGRLTISAVSSYASDVSAFFHIFL